ncbi:hypothetical protein G7Y89_g2960 [Cudoniella acicularis]|uniref:Uncharacterized protein n=1 Tax=Cudoniella acicularis TaxID=354080 RepID=A0A8H4W8V0_9HELO|nr:hypothetical protein G7Y89_g2960 [Cudoniella acicularis]
MATMTNQPLCGKGFRAFPPEIRLMVFRACLENTFHGKIPELIKALRGDPNLYAEAMTVFYKTNTFSLRKQNDWSFGDMEDAAIKTIKSLRVDSTCGLFIPKHLVDNLFNRGRRGVFKFEKFFLNIIGGDTFALGVSAQRRLAREGLKGKEVEEVDFCFDILDLNSYLKTATIRISGLETIYGSDEDFLSGLAGLMAEANYYCLLACCSVKAGHLPVINTVSTDGTTEFLWRRFQKIWLKKEKPRHLTM